VAVGSETWSVWTGLGRTISALMYKVKLCSADTVASMQPLLKRQHTADVPADHVFGRDGDDNDAPLSQEEVVELAARLRTEDRRTETLCHSLREASGCATWHLCC
jgi:hypothetical protein